GRRAGGSRDVEQAHGTGRRSRSKGDAPGRRAGGVSRSGFLCGVDLSEKWSPYLNGDDGPVIERQVTGHPVVALQSAVKRETSLAAPRPTDPSGFEFDPSVDIAELEFPPPPANHRAVLRPCRTGRARPLADADHAERRRFSTGPAHRIGIE